MSEVVVRLRIAAATVSVAALLLSFPATHALASEDKAPAGDVNTLLPATASPNAPAGNDEIKARLAGGPLSIAGEPLHVALLRRFYDEHGDQPVWATHTAQATALWHA